MARCSVFTSPMCGQNNLVVMASQADGYFRSYGDILVHELMLKDEPRVTAYKVFIEENSEIFKDKVVVDVGAGTGILSLLVAKAGAKQVFAIEASDVGELCREIVAKNGYSDKITVIQGRVEDVTLPGNVRADVLISEWMGFYLLHESMLNSVIAARDRFLSPDGVMVPSTATLHMCPVALKDFQRSNFDYWKNVYGFDFSPALPSVKAARLSQPQIMSVKSTDCLSDPYLVIELDLMFVGVEDIRKIYAMPKFVINKNDLLHGFAVWFDVNFEGENPAILSTGPDAPSTHWCQTVIVLPDTLLVSKGETVECQLVMSQDDENPRRYNISVEIPEDEEDEDRTEDEEQTEMVEDYVDENVQEENAGDFRDSMQEAIQEALCKSN